MGHWRITAALLFLIFGAGAYLVWQLGPTPPSWYPRCPLNATTGLFCPGCGSARVLHDLAHGNIGAACGHNILIVCSAPFLAAWGAVAMWRALRYNRPPPETTIRVARIVLIVVLAFMIARNLPWWPFTLLVP